MPLSCPALLLCPQEPQSQLTTTDGKDPSSAPALMPVDDAWTRAATAAGSSRFVGDLACSEIDEPLLRPSHKRLVLFPLQYGEIWQAYKNVEGGFWAAEDVDLSRDAGDWLALGPDERHHLSHVLTSFASSGMIVERGLLERLSSEVQVAEARCFYGFQAMTDNVHVETFSLIINAFVPDVEEQTRLFGEIECGPSLSQKAAWIQRWLQTAPTFADRLVAFAIAHAIFLSSASALLASLKQEGFLSGLTTAHDLMMRDRAAHVDFAALLFHHLRRRTHPAVVLVAVSEAVSIEHECLTEAWPASRFGLDPLLLRQYVESVADRLLLAFGGNAYYKARNPFAYIITPAAQRTPDYSSTGAATPARDSPDLDHVGMRTLVLDDDF